MLPYLRWSDTDSQLVVGILGEDPAESYLRHLVKGQKVNGREVVVQMYKTPTDVGKCHLLFVSAALTQQWSELHKRNRYAGLLTVGETDDFINKGGVFNLAIDDRKLEISRRNAKKALVEINSKLLKICSQK